MPPTVRWQSESSPQELLQRYNAKKNTLQVSNEITQVAEKLRDSINYILYHMGDKALSEKLAKKVTGKKDKEEAVLDVYLGWIIKSLGNINNPKLKKELTKVTKWIKSKPHDLQRVREFMYFIMWAKTLESLGTSEIQKLLTLSISYCICDPIHFYSISASRRLYKIFLNKRKKDNTHHYNNLKKAEGRYKDKAWIMGNLNTLSKKARNEDHIIQVLDEMITEEKYLFPWSSKQGEFSPWEFHEIAINKSKATDTLSKSDRKTREKYFDLTRNRLTIPILRKQVKAEIIKILWLNTWEIQDKVLLFIITFIYVKEISQLKNIFQWQPEKIKDNIVKLMNESERYMSRANDAISFERCDNPTNIDKLILTNLWAYYNYYLFHYNHLFWTKLWDENVIKKCLEVIESLLWKIEKACPGEKAYKDLQEAFDKFNAGEME